MSTDMNPVPSGSMVWRHAGGYWCDTDRVEELALGALSAWADINPLKS